MTPLPTALVASPLPLPGATTPAASQGAGIAFVSQLLTLLQAATATSKQAVSGAMPDTGGDAPAAPIPAAAQSDAMPDTANVMPAAANVQPQVIAAELPLVALAPKPIDTPATQPRSTGGSKPKCEPATPAGRATDSSAQPAAPTALAALQTPDAIVSPPVSPTDTHEASVQHRSSPDRHGEPEVTNAAPRSAPTPAAIAGSKSDGPGPATTETPESPPQGAPPAHVGPAEPAATSALAAPLPAPQQPSVSSPPPAESAATPALAHTPPAAQITPALMQIGHSPDGGQRLTVRLDPPELGHVQIKIGRSTDAPARVEITVEKPETLTLLLRDQPQLQRALDQAGVPAEGRNVTFHIATPEPSARTDAGTAPVAGTAAGGLAGDGSHGAARQHGQPASRQRATTDEDGAEFTPIAATGWLRAGLDITA